MGLQQLWPCFDVRRTAVLMKGATGWLETSVVAQGVEDAPLSVSMATGAGWLLLAGRREGGCRHGWCASLCDFLERMRVD